VKIFLDTNVWLSGRFWPGLCAELLDGLVEAGEDLLLDERVLEEFRRIARDKLKVDDATLARAVLFFEQFAVIVPAVQRAAAEIPDPDDAYIIAAALEAHADVFVTGDQVLLDLGRVGDMPILSPRQAYQRLRGLV
jgi:putative PIN family toxin of toxin-antitoxin system